MEHHVIRITELGLLSNGLSMKLSEFQSEKSDINFRIYVTQQQIDNDIDVEYNKVRLEILSHEQDILFGVVQAIENKLFQIVLELEEAEYLNE